MRRLLLLVVAACWSAEIAPAADGQGRVSLELLTRPGVAATTQQQWYKVFADLGIAGMRMHPGGAKDQPSVSEEGAGAARSYHVVGILASDGKVYLPGAKFSASDGAALRKWFDELGDLGSEGVTQPRAAFGLTPSQLEEALDDLKKPVGFSTRGTTADKAVRRIAGQLEFPLLAAESTERELAATKIGDELQGLSSGTALAVVLRLAGLSLRAERPTGGKLQYRVERSAAGREAWPIGWKPKTRADETASTLFEFLNVAIEDTPVSEAVAAIQGRLRMPLVFDRNAMALHGIKLAAVKANVPEKRMTYSQVLSRVLAPAKLRYELRVDEADRPFVWVTTIRQSG